MLFEKPSQLSVYSVTSCALSPISPRSMTLLHTQQFLLVSVSFDFRPTLIEVRSATYGWMRICPLQTNPPNLQTRCRSCTCRVTPHNLVARKWGCRHIAVATENKSKQRKREKSERKKVPTVKRQIKDKIAEKKRKEELKRKWKGRRKFFNSAGRQLPSGGLGRKEAGKKSVNFTPSVFFRCFLHSPLFLN